MGRIHDSYSPRPHHRRSHRRGRDRNPTPHSREKVAWTIPPAAKRANVLPKKIPLASHALIQFELDSVIGIENSGQVLTLFTGCINSAKLPRRFLKLGMHHYDGSTDPKKFLCTYKYTLDNRGCTPEQLCKLFPEYLEGVANDWFNALPKNTISSFGELGTAFLNRFSKELDPWYHNRHSQCKIARQWNFVWLRYQIRLGYVEARVLIRRVNQDALS